MDKQALYNLEIEVRKNIDIIKNEQEEYVKGVEKGIDLMFDAVRKHLNKQAEEGGVQNDR